MTRVKAFSQGIKGYVNPYQFQSFTKKSVRHRIHRAKKNRHRNIKQNKPYKKRIEELKEEDLDRDIKNYTNLLLRKKKWYQ